MSRHDLGKLNGKLMSLLLFFLQSFTSYVKSYTHCDRESSPVALLSRSVFLLKLVLVCLSVMACVTVTTAMIMCFSVTSRRSSLSAACDLFCHSQQCFSKASTPFPAASHSSKEVSPCSHKAVAYASAERQNTQGRESAHSVKPK